MHINDFSFLIGGEAGAGIARSGFLLAKACMRGGLHVFGTNDYQSLIRGGHNFYVVRISDREVYSQTDYVNLLIALNAETVMLHKGDIAPAGGIIYDQEDQTLSWEKLGRTDLKLYPVPDEKDCDRRVERASQPHNEKHRGSWSRNCSN